MFSISPGTEALRPDLVLRGRDVVLRRFTTDDITPRYLSWLSDPETNEHSQRHGQAPTSAESARHYLSNLSPEEMILAIELESEGHVGNIKFGPVDRRNSRSDISILIGEKAVWGRGVGKRAVYLVSRFLFEEVALHRLDAGSGNPAFIAMVERLGWCREGVLRQRVRIGERLVDWVLLAQLREEFRRRPELETPS